MRGAEAGVVHSLAGPRILVPAGVADQRPAWAGGRAHPVRLGRATLGAADGDGRTDPRHQPGMGLEPPGELGVGRGAEAGEGGSGRAQADARDAAVGREDVGHLVAVQGELGGVRRLAVRSAPLGDVAVVQRPQGLDRALHRRRHLAGHGGVAAVRADHEPAADVDLAATLGQPDAADPVAVAQQRPDGCRLRHLDGRASARPLQEQLVQRRAAHRQPEADVTRALGRPLVRAGRAEPEVPFAGDPRGPRASTSSSTPSRSSTATSPAPRKKCVEMVERGNRTRSTRSTRTPRSPSSAARVDPATRAPTTTTSYSRLIARVSHPAPQWAVDQRCPSARSPQPTRSEILRHVLSSPSTRVSPLTRSGRPGSPSSSSGIELASIRWLTTPATSPSASPISTTSNLPK